MPLYLGDSMIINGQNAAVSGDFTVQQQNLRDSVEHSDIIPCDGSVFGDTMAPLVMSDSQMTEVGYNGWLGNNHFNTGVINWNVRLPGSYPQNQIRYITCAANLLSYIVQPQFIVHGLDSAGNAITNTYSSSTLSSSDGRLIYYVIPIADTYANYDCFELPGHTKIVTTTADTSTFATITNVVIHSVSHPTLGALNLIIKEVNYITNQNTGTISYKFANDSVVQARSAQAVAALYAAIYNKDVTQVQANILAAITRSGAGYNGNVASGVYGDSNVLANYSVADPTVTISYANNRTSDNTIMRSGDTATVTFTFSDNLTDSFAIEQLSATNGTLSNFDGSDSVYTVTFTPNLDQTSAVISMPNFTGFNSVNGNATIRGTSLANMNVDTVSPTMTIASADVTSGGSSNLSSYTMTFTSSETTTNFDVSDINTVNGTISDFSGSGTSYTATFTPGTEGECNVLVGSDTYTDTAGNNNVASNTFTFTYDTTLPVITVTGANPATVDMGSTYTDAGATSDGSETVTTSGSVDTSTVGTYTLTYTATDAAGNVGTATRTVNVVSGPTMTIASNDLTSGGSMNLTSYSFTFTSNEPIQDFTTNDVTITGEIGSIAFGDSILDDNADTIGYNATFTVHPSATGPVSISVAADKFTNTNGYNNTASDTFTFTQTE